MSSRTPLETARLSMGIVMAQATKREIETTLSEIESRSTGAGQPSCGSETPSNANFDTRGHKSTDRKTGVAQSDEHYSWRQVCRLNNVDPDGHDV